MSPGNQENFHPVIFIMLYHSYLYVLQICIDIRENRILVDGDDVSNLAALLLQGNPCVRDLLSGVFPCSMCG